MKRRHASLCSHGALFQSLFAAAFMLSLAIAGRSETTDSFAPESEESVPVSRPAADDSEDPRTKSVSTYWEALGLLKSANPSDVTRGRNLMRGSAELGNPNAQFEMGRHAIAGLFGIRANPEEAFRYFLSSAEGGNGFAMATVGQFYLEGTGVEPDETAATHWLEAALGESADYSIPTPPDEAGSDPPIPSVAGGVWTDPGDSTRAVAHYFLGRIAEKRGDLTKAHEHFHAGATAGPAGRDGNLEAAKEAALDHAFGRGTNRDHTAAREMLAQVRAIARRLGATHVQGLVFAKQLDEIATADTEEMMAKAGDAIHDAMQMEIATRFADRTSKDYEPREALHWFEIAAGDGNAQAMIQLALLLGGKDLGNPDPAAAFGWWRKAGEGDSPLDTLAAGNLAICLQNGIGTPVDKARAAAIFARHRKAEFLCHLGSNGKAPKTVQSPEQAKALLEASAKKGDSQAQYLLGLRLYAPTEGERDNAKAVEWLSKAAKSRHPEAAYMMGVIVDTVLLPTKTRTRWAKKSAWEYYEQASKLGSADAAVALGEASHNAKPRFRDLKAAERHYRRALEIDPKHAAAHYNLGLIFEEQARESTRTSSRESARLRDSAVREYEAAAANGLAVAWNSLGRLHLEGEFVARDAAHAFELFSKAADGGNIDAHYRLGSMHERGESVPVTFLEAAYHYRLAALGGHMEALDRLINFYLTGKGVARDEAMAEHWIRYSVQLGNSMALVELADSMKRRGDHEAAFTLYQSMATSDDRTIAGYGFERLSTCYSEGTGAKADDMIAQGYFELAIERDNPDALTRLANLRFVEGRNADGVALMVRAAKSSGTASYSLGQMYFFGTNVEKDRAKSMELMRQAVALRHGKAMYFLAAATFNKIEEAPDIEEAIRLAELAEQMGVEEAQSLREKLERRREGAGKDQEKIAPARSG